METRTKSHKVFISSTWEDLRPFRAAVRARLEETKDFDPVGMEDFGARSVAPVIGCVREVAESDVLVGIYAWRYGYVPPGRDSRISITEDELRTAVNEGIPVLCFFAEDSLLSTWPDEHREGGEGGHLLEELKKQLQRDYIVEKFSSPEDLAQKVAKALTEHFAAEASRSPERRRLFALWQTVHRFWIEDVLRIKVPEEQRIRIHRNECPEEVDQRPVSPAARRPGSEVVVAIHHLFQQKDGRLLILGEPGSGKTIVLLELAEELGRRANASLELPIPVVFNLGSWMGSPSLAKWLEGELRESYDAGTKDPPQWIEHGQIVPLLDGVDEVEPGCRAECIDAINHWLSERGKGEGMAVCCNTQVYHELQASLRLMGAIELEPLTRDQIDSHLARSQDFAGLRAAAAGSSELMELMKTPLLLSLLEETYRGALADRIEVRDADEAFEGFVSHALQPESELPFAVRRNSPPRRRRLYPPDAARRSLAWLARKTSEHRAPLFKIERLQPAWLDSRGEIWAYALSSRAFGGALLALPPVWIYRSPALLALGLVAGAIAGAIDAGWLQRSSSVSKRTGARALRRPVGRGLLIGLGVLAVLFLLAPLWRWLFPSGTNDPGKDFRNLLHTGLLFAPLFGLVFGVRGAFRDRNHDVRVRERIELFVWKRWSWRLARLAAVWSAAAGLLLAAFMAFLDPTGRLVHSAHPAVWPLLVPALFLLGGVAGGAIGGLRREHLAKEEQSRDWPGRGIWRTLSNAGLVALCIWVPTTAAIVVFNITTATHEGWRWTDVSGALEGGMAIAVWAALWFSGLDVVQHYTLRLILHLRGRVPFRLVRFLDYATERGVLQSLGGSYQFYHPLLREHLAFEQGVNT